jgi:hypothetical protein
MNLFHRDATKLGSAAAITGRRRFHEQGSNQMRRMLSFAFGVLIGTIVATAWAQYQNYPTVDSPRNQTGAIVPFEMMIGASALPVEHHDAI